MYVRDRLLVALLAVSSLVALAACGSAAAPAAAASPAAVTSNATDAPGPTATVDTGYAIVQLTLDPLSISAKTKPPKGKKIDFNSATVKSYRALLSAQRNDYKQWLQANAPNAKITGQFDISLNAVSVKLNGETLGTVSSAPQVKTAQYEGLYYPVALGDPDLDLIKASEARMRSRSGSPSATG